jgi:hypothetical protein
MFMSETDGLAQIAATIAAGLIQAQAKRDAGGKPTATEAVYKTVLAELEKRRNQRKAAEEASAKVAGQSGGKKLDYPNTGIV